MNIIKDSFEISIVPIIYLFKLIHLFNIIIYEYHLVRSDCLSFTKCFSAGYYFSSIKYLT